MSRIRFDWTCFQRTKSSCANLSKTTKQLRCLDALPHRRRMAVVVQGGMNYPQRRRAGGASKFNKKIWSVADSANSPRIFQMQLEANYIVTRTPIVEEHLPGRDPSDCFDSSLPLHNTARLNNDGDGLPATVVIWQFSLVGTSTHSFAVSDSVKQYQNAGFWGVC